MKLSKFTIILAALAVPFGASAAERLYLEAPVQFAPNALVMSRAKSECDIEKHLADDAEAGINKRYGHVELAAKGQNVGNDKVVKLTIVALEGLGGGSWTGSKSMTVLAELKRGEDVLAAKVFTRASRGANIFAGTCSLFENVTDALGSDIGKWLKRGAGAEPAAAAN